MILWIGENNQHYTFSRQSSQKSTSCLSSTRFSGFSIHADRQIDQNDLLIFEKMKVSYVNGSSATRHSRNVQKQWLMSKFGFGHSRKLVNTFIYSPFQLRRRSLFGRCYSIVILKKKIVGHEEKDRYDDEYVRGIELLMFRMWFWNLIYVVMYSIFLYSKLEI